MFVCDWGGHRSKLCGNARCSKCFQRSIASMTKISCLVRAKCPSDPCTILKSSKKALMWKCSNCPHEFEASPVNVDHGRWCPYCSGNRLCGNCDECTSKSMFCHPLCDQLLTVIGESTTNTKCIPIGSHKMATWKCHICSHEFQSKIQDVTVNKQWCGFCGNKRLCSCADCFAKSLASTPAASLFVVTEDGESDASRVFKRSNKRAIFQCKNCGEHRLQVVHDSNKFFGCMTCKPKSVAHTMLASFLSSLPVNTVCEWRVDWCKDKNQLPFDFYIEEYQCVVEVDGIQHFQAVKYFGGNATFEVQKRHDVIKIRSAINNNISIVRVSSLMIAGSKETYWKEWMLMALYSCQLAMTSNPVVVVENGDLYHEMISRLNGINARVVYLGDVCKG